MMKKIFLLTMLLATASYGIAEDHQKMTKFDIAEAVFKHMFKSQELHHSLEFTISLYSRRPSSEFLQRFAGHVPPVHGEHYGENFSINKIEINAENNEAVAVGGFRKSRADVSSVRFVARKNNEEWQIIKGQPLVFSEADRMDIAETVFKRLLQRRVPSAISAAFLQVDGKDPDAMFMERFKGHILPVKKGSTHKLVGCNDVIDPETGGAGVVYSVGDIQMIADDEAIVVGVESEACDAGQVIKYFLSKVNAEWKITKEIALVIAESKSNKYPLRKIVTATTKENQMPCCGKPAPSPTTSTQGRI